MKAPFKSQVFRRCFALATFVLFIAAISVTLASMRTEQMLIRNKTEESLATLNEIANITGKDIFRAANQAESLIYEREILAVSEFSGGAVFPQNQIALLSARDRLDRYQIGSDLIAECAVIFPDCNMLTLTTHHIVTNLQLHYESGLLRYEGMSYSDMLEHIALDDRGMQTTFALFPCRTVELAENGRRQIITAAKSIYFPGRNDRVAVLLMIDADAIARQVSTFLPGYDGWLALTDRSGNVLYMVNETDESPEQILDIIASGAKPRGGVVLEALSTNAMGFGFRLFLPDAWINQQVSPMLNPLQLVMMLTLGAMSVIAVGTMLFSGAPLTRLEIKFRSALKLDPNPIRNLERGVDELFDSNAKLHNTIRSMLPRMTAGILERLYKGGITEDDEIDLVSALKETLPEEFRVVILCWRNYPDERNRPLPLHLDGEAFKLLLEYFEDAWIHRCDINTIAFLADTMVYDDVKLATTLRDILAELTDTLPLLFSMGAGGRYSNMNAIHSSYIEARMALARVEDRSTERVVVYREENRSAIEYVFPMEYKDRLATYIKGGDIVYMRNLMKQIFERNFIARRVDESDQARYYNDLTGILLSLSAEIRLGEKQDGLASLRMPGEVYEHFLSLFGQIVTQQQHNRNHLDEKLRDKILRYIDINYKNSALSLKLMAEKFSMTEKYISHFFKAQNNMNFSEYIEEKRLAEALRLMADAGLPLSRVHIMAGYATSSTFYKAFRRRYGMSPSAWRESHRASFSEE